jgi:hypothetical protein
MFGNLFGSEPTRSVDEPAVMGLFPYGIDARRALQALHERNFTSGQITAAFRVAPDSRTRSSEPSGSMRDNDKWFGQLREIYRGEDGANRKGADQFEPEISTVGFDAMMAQIDLSPQDVRLLDHDPAIVAVRAGARNAEARVLLEQRGARIVQGRQDPEARKTVEATPPVTVNTQPFQSPPPAESDHITLRRSATGA